MAKDDIKEAEIVTGSLVKRSQDALEKSEDKLTLPSRAMEEGFEEEISRLIPKAGTIDIDDRQKGILFSKVKDQDIEIRPDGLIYLPWSEYVTRLSEAFGLGFSFIPKGLPKVGPEKTSILWGWYLIIKGVLMGFAIGEVEYQAKNRTMSWSDACEGAKSNAIMRLCKGLGMCGLELWKPSFVKNYLKKYGDRYWDEKAWNSKTNGYGKWLWRKKGIAQEEEGPKEKKEEKPEIPKEKAKEPAAKKNGTGGEGDFKALAKGIEKGRKGNDSEPPDIEFPEDTGRTKHDEPPPPSEDSEEAPPWEGKPEDDEEKERIIALIKKKIKESDIDGKDFKAFLYEHQKAPGINMTMVQKNQYGKISFHEGTLEHLKKLNLFFFDWAKPSYLKAKKGKK